MIPDPTLVVLVSQAQFMERVYRGMHRLGVLLQDMDPPGVCRQMADDLWDVVFVIESHLGLQEDPA